MNDYITGASGFIGSWLASQLNEVTAIPHHQIELFLQRSKHCRHFYFLSTYGNMIHHADTADIIQANIQDLSLVIQKILINKLNCESFVFLSTSSVLLPVQTPHSLTKRAAELILESVKGIKGIPICIVRPYSVTGIGEQREHLIPTLIRSCFEGEPVKLALWPTHDFVDVQDVVSRIRHLAGQQAVGTFEIGNGIAWTNEEVLGLVETACGRKANITPVTWARPYDTKDWRCKERVPGTMKTLEQSIAEMVASYLKQAI